MNAVQFAALGVTVMGPVMVSVFYKFPISNVDA